MSTCQQCGAPVAFSAVLMSINPYKIKCKQCQRPIRLGKVSASIIMLFIICIALYLVTSFAIIKDHLAFIALPFFLSVQVFYFIMIRKKIISIKSNILG